MSVRVEQDAIRLAGRCGVEDAETLLSALSESPGLAVDLSEAQRIHMAVAQVLFAVRPALRGVSDNRFIADHLIPLFAESREW